MGQVAESTASSDASPSRAFLVELERAWALLRLYGDQHPAFRQRAGLAAAAASQPLRIGVGPKGFLSDSANTADDELQPLAKRLSGMGVVGLIVSAGLAVDHITGLVQALEEAERSRANIQLVMVRIANATGGKVKVLPVRMDDLRYVTGSSAPAGEDDATATWRELFVRACGGDGSAPAEAAKWFEAAVRGVQSSGHWTSMLDVWVRELGAIEATPAGDAAEAVPVEDAGRVDGVALFLQALSPQLRQRLLADTLSHRRAPERVVLSLAERLPTAVVLGAFATLDQTSGEPSPAALALLRKLHLHLTGNELPEDPPPRSNAELAKTSSSLQKLLESQHERNFVPDEYLRRREELSRQSVAPASDTEALVRPTAEQTSEHAANVALQIITSTDVRPEHLLSGLEFVQQRIGQWVRAGQFTLASQAIAAACTLRSRSERPLAEAAKSLLSAAYDVDAVQEGLSHAAGRVGAEGIAKLLGHADGETLGRLLSLPVFTATGEGRQPLLDAVGELLTRGSDQSIADLFQALQDRPPTVVLAALRTIPPEDAVNAVERILPHASATCRRIVAQSIFDRNLRWPLDLTRRLLEDGEPAIRRFAMMRLMRDADLGTVAGFLHMASRSGPFPVDVALGLAELLRPHRNHKDVRAAYKRWIWSARRWGTFLFMRIGGERRGDA